MRPLLSMAVLLSLTCRSTASSTIATFVSTRAASPVVGVANLRSLSRSSSVGTSFQHLRPHPKQNQFCRNMSSTSRNESEENDNVGLTDIGTKKDTNADGKRNNIKKFDESDTLTWKQRIDISIAKSRKIRGSNYVQISTIDYETMEPRCRTVVFRGFVKDVPLGAVKDILIGGGNDDENYDNAESGNYDCVMKMITDMRSNKVKELEGLYNGGGKGGNSVELVWWFPKSSEQYRVRGKLQFIGNNGPLFQNEKSDTSNNDYFLSERKQQWGNLSDPAREQFYWNDANYLGTPSDSQIPPGGRDEEGKVLPPPDAFLLMFLYPTKVDYLRLGDNFRQIDELKWGGDGGGCQWNYLHMNH